MPLHSIGAFGSRIVDHFQHPRNVGVAANHNRCYFEQDNPWLIQILFTLRVDQGRIQEIRFRAQSCVTTTACLSALTEMVQGRTVDRARSITPELLSDYLGNVPPEKAYCCRLVVETFRKALGKPHQCAIKQHLPQGGHS